MKDRFALITGALFLLMASLAPKDSREGLRNFFKLPTNFGTSLFGGGDTSEHIDANSLSTQARVDAPSYDKYPNGHTDYDVDIMARTIWGEARSEGYKGMQAVANVIMNRFELAQSNSAYARRFGKTVADICLKPWQFSVWNDGEKGIDKLKTVTIIDRRFETAIEIATKAVQGRLNDITANADHYLNVPFTRQIRPNGDLPNWADLTKTTKKIGAHTFLRLA